MDRRGHGGSEISGYDHEPHRRFAIRPRESPDETTGAGDRRAFGWIRVALYRAGRGSVLCGCVATEFTGPEAGAVGHCDFVFLFVYEALHELVASLPGICTGDFSGGSLDCHYGHARLADADSLRCGDAVGGRV